MQSNRDLFQKYEFRPDIDFQKDDYTKLVFEAEKIFLEKEKLAHSRWWQEDSLVHNRLTWLLQSQVILFAAFGLLARNDGGSELVQTKVLALTSLLPWIGLAICIVIGLGIRSAWKAQQFLYDFYEPQGIFVGVCNATTIGGRVPGYAMPLVFVFAWGWLTGGLLCAIAFLAVTWGVFQFVDMRLTNPKIKYK